MKTLSKISSSLTTAGVLAMSTVQSAFAQFAGPSPDLEGIPDAADADGLRDTIVNIITAILNFLALIAVIIIIIAGIRLIVSQGEEEPKEKAKKTIFYAIVGLVIVLFARVIVGLVTVYLAQEIQN